MDIFKFITSLRGKFYTMTQQPFIRLITVYVKDGKATDVGITAKGERMKKARLVGLCEERKIFKLDDETEILNPGNFDIQKGSYELIYYLDKKELKIFKFD